MVSQHQTRYENELKEILSGSGEVLDRMIARLHGDERLGYECIRHIPFVVVRAAGSFGMDLIALRGEFAFPVEVKASASDTIRLSRQRRLTRQRDELLEACRGARILPLYAFRRKGIRNADPWRIFSLPVDDLTPRLRTILRHIPPVGRTSRGMPVLVWSEGVRLSELLRYLEYMVSG